MSRCLPFSPQAFANRGSNWEALIKLQKEKVDPKSERRREKKDKKKSKKEKRHKEKKDRKIKGDENTKKLSDEKKDKPCLSSGYKSEQLERSDITEEHDQPSCSGSHCSFLDSVDSCNKRKRPENSACEENQRTSRCIRLPLRNHNEPNTPEGLEIRSQTTTIKHDSTAETKPESPLSKSERRKIKRSKTRLFYKTLVEDWVPNHHRLSSGEIDFDDEGWLSGSKSGQPGQEPKRHKAGDEVSCSRSNALWPQAIHSMEVDIVVLPYTWPY